MHFFFYGVIVKLVAHQIAHYLRFNCKKLFDTTSAPLKYNPLLFNIYYNLAKVGVASSSLVSRSKI